VSSVEFNVATRTANQTVDGIATFDEHVAAAGTIPGESSIQNDAPTSTRVTLAHRNPNSAGMAAEGIACSKHQGT
jgi:copper chaperone CopZ